MGVLDGRVAISTGAGRGRGREHALLMTVEDSQVVSDLGGTLAMEQFDVTETRKNDDRWRVTELAAKLPTLLQ